MAIDTGNQQLDSLLTSGLIALAARNDPQGNLLSGATRIPESVFHDFSSYRFVVPPRYAGAALGPVTWVGVVAGVPANLGASTKFESFVSSFDAMIHACIAAWIASDSSKMILGGYSSDRPSWDVSDDDVALGIEASARAGFRYGMALSLFDLYTATARHTEFLAAASDAVADWLSSALPTLRGTDDRYSQSELFTVGDATFWQGGEAQVLAELAAYRADTSPGADTGPQAVSDLPAAYPFQPFETASVNFGLQVVYRQGWVPLGTQPGEIVRTLPLGPKQSEKISFKVVRRRKTARQAEIATSVETTTETSTATKDSTELVQEASEKFNWHVEASASASWGFGSAEIKAGMGGENSSASKDAKSLLNETMEKTASKMRKDTKIVVSTEAEETSELSQMSEITNPNDEIAVTYVYSRLQRQYELRTYLSEVNQVVFVAEPMPAPEEITGSWIRKYDWVIAQELLDESFRSDLDAVRNYDAETFTAPAVDARISRLMETLSGSPDSTGQPAGIPDYGSLQGAIPDLFANQQAAYERELERKRAKEADQELYQRSLRRLRAQIYENILHYCRAIWSAEDPDARTLRYQGMRVPVQWEFAANASSAGSVDGYLLPAITSYQNDTVPLADLINPAGPIGFAGNYAVFYLRQSSRWASLTEKIALIQAPYLTYDVSIDRGTLPATVQVKAAVSDDIIGACRLRCTVSFGSGQLPQLTAEEWRDGSHWVSLGTQSFRDGVPLQFAALRIWVSTIQALSDGDRFEALARPGQFLEDPELKALRWSVPPLASDRRADFFTPSVIAEMREYFSDVYLALSGESLDLTWEQCSAAQQALMVSRYYDYLLRKRHTRRIVLDTNNLLLTREVDSRTTLEPFKGLHRVIDVLRAGEDMRAVALENERKRLRLDAAKLGDPDVDKVTVVAAGAAAADLAALDGLDAGPGGGTGSGGQP